MVKKGIQKETKTQEKTQVKPEQTKETKPQGIKKPKAPKPKKKITYRYYIDCSIPVEDGIFDLENFVSKNSSRPILISQEQFFIKKYKVSGKTGNLAAAKVRFWKQQNQLRINTQQKISKRYLKYLTKKYLKKQELRDWLHVIRDSKRGYILKYFNITPEEGTEETEEKNE